MGRLHASYRQQIRFVSDASHELRTPISVIRGYAEMLDRWGKDDKKILGEGITAIRTETDNMQQLVEQLLFLARGDAGRNQPQMKPLDLAKLMQELHEEYTMIDKGHVWQLQQDGPVPATGDPAQLKQVFSWLAIAPSVANFVGPFLAGVVIDHAGFRASFATMAVLAVISWALVRNSVEVPAATSRGEAGQSSSWDLLAEPRMRQLLLVNWL